MQQIIAMGGGGFSMEPDNFALDRYVMEQSNASHPKVCFLSQASGESHEYIIDFYQAFLRLACRPSHLSLFKPHTTDIEDFLMAQDIIYVGGGNTKSMLALWREWGLDRILLNASHNGTILAGISAGANCWFEYCTTDSFSSGNLAPLPCLGYLDGSCSPHYDGEELRRPTFHRLIASGEIPNGLAFDDGSAGHFIDGKLERVVSSRPQARGYRVAKTDDGVEEIELDTQYLLA
ncbi:MAG: peptidase E [Chloroflexi bacterium]|nr:MAG: peptidase E [Chloroflexota bacterium]